MSWNPFRPKPKPVPPARRPVSSSPHRATSSTPDCTPLHMPFIYDSHSNHSHHSDHCSHGSHSHDSGSCDSGGCDSGGCDGGGGSD